LLAREESNVIERPFRALDRCIHVSAELDILKLHALTSSINIQLID
jgi:hypothetical protein